MNELVDFDEVVERTEQFVAGELELDFYATWLRDLYYDSTLVEPDAYDLVRSMRMRVGEYLRLVGWTLGDLKQHLASRIASARDESEQRHPCLGCLA